MKIVKLSMNGIGNYTEKTTYEFNDYNIIEGDNGTGKTTIGDAIAWAFTGANFLGIERSVSSLMNQNSNFIEVELDFIFKGEKYNLLRIKKDSNLGIYLNGIKIKATDLHKFIINKNIFFSIFNPSYFPKLQPRQSKIILESLFKPIDKEEVFKHLDDSTVKLLISNDFHNPNLFLEKKRAEISELKEDITHNEGYIHGKSKTFNIPKHQEFDDTELNNLKDKLDNLYKELSCIKLPHNINKLKEQRLLYEKEISKLDNLDVELVDIIKLNNELQQLELKKSNIPIKAPQIIDVNSLKNKKEQLLDNYYKIKKEIMNMNNRIKCPKCNNVIDLDQEHRMILKKSLNNIKEIGKNLAQDIINADKNNEALLNKYSKQKVEYLEPIERSIENVKIEINRAKEENEKRIIKHKKDISKKVSILEDKILKLNIEKCERENVAFFEKEQDKRAAEIKDIKELIKLLEKQKTAIEGNNRKRLELINEKKQIDEDIQHVKKDIEEYENRIKYINMQISAAKLYNAKKLEIQTNNINTHFKHVSLRFQKLIESTGEVKDDFKILYDSKPFLLLSKAEEVKAGLEISNLIRIIVNTNIPVFIDDATTITRYNRPNCQIFEARAILDKNTVEIIKHAA